MSDRNDILNFEQNKSGGRIPEDKLMAYLEGKLSPDEQHEIELWLAEEGMESDALEGLKAIRPEEAKHSVQRLNHTLRKKLLHKKRTRRRPKNDHLTWIAIVVILLLAVLAYIVIRKSI